MKWYFAANLISDYTDIFNKTDSTLTSRTGWSAASSISFAFNRLITGIIIARIAGPEGVGKIAYLLWVADFALMITSLGLNASIIRFVAEMRGANNIQEAEQLSSWIFVRYFSLTLAGTVILILVSFLIQTNRSDLLLWILMSMLFFVQGLGTLYQAILAGNQRFDLLARLNFGYSILLVVGVVFGAWTWGIFGILGSYFISACLPATLGIFMLKIKRMPPPLNKSLSKRIWKYSINTWIAAIVSSFVWSRMEIFFLNYYWNNYEVALFTIGITLSSTASQGAMLLSGALVPHFAERLGANDMEGIRKAYSSATKLIGVIVFPISLGGAALIPLLVPLLYGSAFIGAIPVCMILMIFALLNFCSAGSALVYGLERSYFIAMSGLVGAIISFTINLILIPKMGSMGAVLVRSGTQVLMIVAGTYYIITRMRCPFPFASLAKNLLISFMCAAIIYIPVKCHLSWIILLLNLISSAVIYLLLIRFFKVLTQKDLKPMEEIAYHFPTKLREKLMRFLAWFIKPLPA